MSTSTRFILILGAVALADVTTLACKNEHQQPEPTAQTKSATRATAPAKVTAPADSMLAGGGDWGVSWRQHDPTAQRDVPKGCQLITSTAGPLEGQIEDDSGVKGDKDADAGPQTINPDSGISHNGFTPQCIVIGGVSWSEAWRDLARHWLSKLPIAEFPNICEPGGPKLVGYLARCALADTQAISFQCGADRYEFHGQHGVATAWFDHPLDLPGRERVTACLMAHANQQGVTVPIWMEADFMQRGAWNTTGLIREGAFAGNLFVDDGEEIELLAFHAKGYTSAPSTSPGRVCTLDNTQCGFDVDGTTCTRATTADYFASCTNGALTRTHVLTTWLKKDSLTGTTVETAEPLEPAPVLDR